MEIRIAKQTAAASAMFKTNSMPLPGVLSIIGVLGVSETVTVEIPTLEDYNGVDLANDAHWTALYQDGSPVTLTSTHNAECIPIGLMVRIKKPVTSAAVGVRWE